MELYKLVRTKKDKIVDNGLAGSSKTIIKAGSEGYVVHDLGEGHYLVEFSEDIYSERLEEYLEEELEIIEK